MSRDSLVKFLTYYAMRRHIQRRKQIDYFAFLIYSYFYIAISVYVGRCSSVGIATRYGLGGPGIESRWGRDFSAPVQTRPGVHPVPHNRYRVTFTVVRRPKRGVEHPPHLAARSKKE
jgi:hypothetical protein